MKLRQEDIVLGFIGGIRPNKGLRTLVRAFKEVNNPNLRLIIAGKPWPPEDYLESLRSLSSSDKRIHIYPSFIPNEEIQIFLKSTSTL